MVPLAGDLWVLDKDRDGLKLDVDGLPGMAMTLLAPPQTVIWFGWVKSSAPGARCPTRELLHEIPAGVKLSEFQQDFPLYSFAEERMAVLELPNSAAARRQPRRPRPNATAYPEAAIHRLPAAPAARRRPESAHARTRARRAGATPRAAALARQEPPGC